MTCCEGIVQATAQHEHWQNGEQRSLCSGCDGSLCSDGGIPDGVVAVCSFAIAKQSESLHGMQLKTKTIIANMKDRNFNEAKLTVLVVKQSQFYQKAEIIQHWIIFD